MNGFFLTTSVSVVKIDWETSLRLQVSIFGFVSDFDIRISDFARSLLGAITFIEVVLLNI